jgi:hypothetical protein
LPSSGNGGRQVRKTWSCIQQHFSSDKEEKWKVRRSKIWSELKLTEWGGFSLSKGANRQEEGMVSSMVSLVNWRTGEHFSRALH